MFYRFGQHLHLTTTALTFNLPLPVAQKRCPGKTDRPPLPLPSTHSHFLLDPAGPPCSLQSSYPARRGHLQPVQACEWHCLGVYTCVHVCICVVVCVCIVVCKCMLYKFKHASDIAWVCTHAYVYVCLWLCVNARFIN